MKNKLKSLIFITSLFSLFFSLKTEAAPILTCNTKVNQDGVNVNIETNEGSISDYKVGIIKSSDGNNLEQTVYGSTIDISNTLSSSLFLFSSLDSGIKYDVLIFNKVGGIFVQKINSCQFTSPLKIDGVCGSSNGKTLSSKPTTNLCSKGILSEIGEVNGEWRWNCEGEGGGDRSPLCRVILSSTTSGNTGGDASSEKGGLVPACPITGCGFPELILLISNIITFLLFTIATPLAALIFAYAGIMLLTSGGDTGKLKTAKKIIGNLLIGYVIALAAWLIINTILSKLGFHGSWFLTRY